MLIPPPTAEDRQPVPSRLPPELWLLVIQNTKYIHTLLALALCCSSFRDETQRNLFYHPRISESTAAQQYRFIHTITTSPPRLGLLIRVYEHKHGRENPGVPGGTHREVRAALRAMRNLKQLSLTKARTISLRVLDGCRFKLDVFEYGRPRREDLDVLPHFLATQPTLQHLALNGRCPSPGDRQR
ncbi:hypothetical protein D9619_004880 [Psilocybe cf. subviscida]|uniref:F-box domain-containing protein n=1 Tax=Psilocybe cf. subviscida TaxID=2480587 RepID=A0A8H5BPP5_9AGAR|nr:hypothetical protein D9619_004880 [Psilocybe cf. subviscida]